MSLIYYFSIYGLLEALIVSLIATMFFGFNWWKMYRLQKRQVQIDNSIVEQFKAEIIRIHELPATRPELNDVHVLLLKAIGMPFKKHQANQIDSWNEIIHQMERYFENLTQTTQANSQSNSITLKNTDTDVYAPENEVVDDELSAESLDSAITDLMSHYQAANSAILNNQEATEEMKVKFQNLQLVNQELRSIIQSEKTSELLEKFDAYEQMNAVFMRTIAVKERNYKSLVKEHEMLEVYIHNLQVTVTNYRKSIQKLLIKESSLVEENRLLLEQQESNNRLVTRLNRNYETLRNEYTKLFETTIH
ncbi:hypothetical protein [Chromatium okenii]|uniref:hypothetical protein n=1 Tax=Chromatium okenii TaxID=61644 RepID=UPI0026E9D3A3|nr:hypothetical protein [Chromatium okenii]MBV5309431.1 hypothetical protein [Chromatium okenii]